MTLFSPRMARRLAEAAPDLSPDVRLLCLSAAVAAALPPDAPPADVASEPTARAMIALLEPRRAPRPIQ